jgi:ribosomal protein L7/L12
MAKGPTTFSELREQEYTASIGTAVTGVAIIVVALILLFVLNRVLVGTNQSIMRVAIGIGVFAGISIVTFAAVRSSRVNKTPIVPFKCPYCDRTNRLVARPTEDFDCEHCLRTIRFEAGKMVPVRTISCTNCGADQRISVKAERCICDKCNAVMQVHADDLAGTRSSVAAPVARPGILLTGEHHVVLIQGYDSAHEQKVAGVLQHELGVDLLEARRLLATVSEKTPLIIAYDVPQSDAEALRQQLEQSGANVQMRATSDSR